MDGEKMTREALSKKTGTSGEEAFVAVDGRVYDVTSSDLWEDGEHMGGHNAGQDLTDAITDAPHGMEVFDELPVVGELED
jgi:predicted heme/steroid binding protein